MGKFQLNKKGEDPIKIYEDTFKIAQGTVETHLGKFGKMPNPISRESDGTDVFADIEKYGNDGKTMTPKERWDWTGKRLQQLMTQRGESKAKEVNGKYVLNGMVIGKVTDFEPKNWFGKVELSAMPEFAEFGTLDPLAVVEGDDGVTYKDPKGGSDGSRGTLLEPDGNPMVNVTSYDEDHKEDFLRDLYGEVESIAKEAISEDEKDDIFQYLFDLQDSGVTNMFGAGPYVEREFPHLDKKEVSDVVTEWMSNWDEIAKRMGVESKASESETPPDVEKGKRKLEMQGNGSDMDGNQFMGFYDPDLEEPYRDLDEESWNSVEAIASEDIFGGNSDFEDVRDQVPFDEQQNRYRNARDEESPLDNIYSDDKTAQDIASGTHLTYASTLWDKESKASEDYGNMNIVQNPDLDTDGYPMDQEGFARSNWDDASIEDRKNWLLKAGYDSDNGDEYKPYFSLDSYIRSQLIKDLHIGGIYAMGTGSL